MRDLTVFHFLGYDEDRGGVLSAIRLLAAQGGVRHVIVVNPGFVQRRTPLLTVLPAPRVPVEAISLRSLWPTLRAACSLLAVARRGDAVVHGQSRAGTLVGLWLWFLGCRNVVISPHCYGRQRWFYRWAASCLGERWTWLSPAMKRYYGIGGSGWAACIPEPVAVARHQRQIRPLRGSNDAITIGGAGTLVEWKAWHLVLQALARLPPAARWRFRFIHIGDPDGTAASLEYRDRLFRETAAMNLTAQIEWRGWQPDTLSLLAEVDVMVVPSRDEPMSLAGLEALGAGVPLIVADTGGLNDVVRKHNALVFRSGDADDLADRFRELLSTDLLRRITSSSSDLELVASERVAAAWRERYAAASEAGVMHVI